MWEFSTDEAYAEKLRWADEFVRREILPLETLDLDRPELLARTAPLKQQVKDAGLWACHLGPELGGAGYGQVKLGLLHEVIGITRFAPPVFGNQAPDSGNAEILALFGTEEQKASYLRPLLDGDIFSAFCLTEPGAGSDPTRITTTAVRDGDEWVINGGKWFASNAAFADVLLVVCKTDPDAPRHQQFSTLLVAGGTPGLRIVGESDLMGAEGTHAQIAFEDCRVPAAALLGEQGRAFEMSQRRLGPGRIHHVMRWLGVCRRAFDMMCERAVSREVSGGLLADKQTVQNWIADSYAEIQGLRLMTLHAAWVIDQKGVPEARTEIAAIKYHGAKVLMDVLDRAIQVHGALGVSSDMPLEYLYRRARASRIYDGPDEVHRVTVARRVLRGYTPVTGMWPSEHVPTRRAAALAALGSQDVAAAESASLR
ncbi:acyl-CoA dehydrogenase family protein [Blastococcus sp. URHD0036]|uniref:acyl-CoA dehydrogenase family protein n=1 Tax=Blastococcus sp. URHD0036 TaxID=1380356 RepID=UPI000496977E|nr:acyl-CoA dehydrogenase family protein [Blastococcus sp. URHD0036]